MATNPRRPLHALLAGFVQDTLIENQNQRHKCLDKLDNQLTKLLHELYSLARTKSRNKIYQNSCRRNHADFENLIWPNEIYFNETEPILEDLQN